MTVRTFLIGSLAGAIVGWGIWALIINWIDPTEAGLIGYVLFFLALFLAIASVVGLFGYTIRRILIPKQMASYRVRPSLRQGIWLGFLFDILLFLQLQRLLRWWISLIIIALFLAIEFFFLSYDKSQSRHRSAHADSQE